MHRALLASLAVTLVSLTHAADSFTVLLGTYTRDGSRGIYRVTLDRATGALSTPQLVAETPHPSFLALHPGRKTVYALTEIPAAGGAAAGAIAAFQLDPLTGDLTPRNVQASTGGSFAHLAVDATGTLLLAASYNGASVVAFPLAPDGRVLPPVTQVTHQGPLGPHRARQDQPHPHSVTLSPDNRYAFVADLGLDRILAYTLDPTQATFRPAAPAFTALAPGAGPRHTAFSPDGAFLYSINELNSTVTACRYDRATGALSPVQSVSTLPDDFSGANTTSEIRLHPGGRFAYGANRGHDSLAVFARALDTGALTRVDITPTGGRVPRNFALSPDGDWLLCAHQDSNNLTVFRIDAASGRLTRTPHSVDVPKAVCVLFLP